MMHPMKRTISVLKFIGLIGLVAASFSFAMFQGGFVSWFLFGSFLPIAFYSILLNFYPIKRISIKRVLDKTEYVYGEIVSVKIHINLPYRIPLGYLFIKDEVSERSGGRPFSGTVLFPLFSKERTYTYHHDLLPRGEYTFCRIRIQMGDLFGLTRKELVIEQLEKIVVYPAYIEMKYDPFKTLFESGMTAAKDLTQRDSTMAISTRTYQSGDRFSWIHWKQTARKNEIMTKEFEQRQSQDVLLILDRTPSPSFELAVKLTASIVRSAVKAGTNIGLLSYGVERQYFPVQGGETQLRILNYHLATVNDDLNHDFHTILETEIFLKKPGQTMIFLVSQLRKEVMEKITDLYTRNNEIGIFLIKSRLEKVKPEEAALLEYAKGKGLNAKVVRESDFTKAFER